MKKVLLFVSLVMLCTFVATRSSFGTKGDALKVSDNHRLLTTNRVSTYYPSTWKGNAIVPADAGNMYAYTYLVNYASNTATLMSGPTYSMFALSAACRDQWLNSKVDPSCVSGCRTWSYYYRAAPAFTSNINYLAVACPD